MGSNPTLSAITYTVINPNMLKPFSGLCFQEDTGIRGDEIPPFPPFSKGEMGDYKEVVEDTYSTKEK